MLKFILALISMLIVSCSSPSLISYNEENKNDYLAAYLKRNASIKSFEADANVTLNYYEAGKLETQKFNATIMWNANDSLAIEMNYGVMGINLADVAKLFVGKNNYVFVTRDNLFLTGLSDDDYLNQLFRIDIPLKEWAPILFMNILFRDLDYDQSIVGTQLILKKGDRKIIFRNDVQLPGRFEYITRFGGIAKITYEGLIETDNIQFPQRVVYFNETDKSETIITFNSIKVNKRLPKKGFEVKIPSQMEQIIYD